MPDGTPFSKKAANLPEQPERLINPPPFSLTGAGAAAIAARNAKGSSRTPSGELSTSIFSTSSDSGDAVLEPKPGYDVVSLIFLMLILPQSVSCLVLTSYILSGSFKSLAGKFIAGVILRSDDEIELDLEPPSETRYPYYRSELLGEFLQLFSINSFILLICHYTLPRAWFQYLIVLAKSIVASRLVGSHATGSTTYVSVVSNNAHNSGSVTTTTTTNKVQPADLNGATKSETRSVPSSFANFITGFSFVIAVNYIKERIANINASMLLEDLSRLGSLLLISKGDTYDRNCLDPAEPLLSSSSPITSSDYIPSRKTSYFEDTRIFSTKATWMNRLLLQSLVKILRLGDKSVSSLSFASREILIVINFAYLVLCIHVISLTISPLFKRIFILRDYSKTLDHLSCLTPDVPYGGYKKGGLISSLPRDATTDTVVVINMEQPRSPPSIDTEPYEIVLRSDLSNNSLSSPLHDSTTSVVAQNFKNFCSKPPGNKASLPGSKVSHNRTIVDRKRSNSTTAPSTTIMDKYYIISTQPIWTWIAAMKILMTRPTLFSAPPSGLSDQSFDFGSDKNVDFALILAEDSKVVFQVLDISESGTLESELSVHVNGIRWMFTDLYASQTPVDDIADVYISIYGLSASCQYRIEFLRNDVVVRHCFVSTTSSQETRSSTTLHLSAVDVLRSSLIHSIGSLGDLKISFKKLKKEESKRVAELKRQMEAVKAKIDKYEVTQSSEGRKGGKLKGLQNSVAQLENEIQEIERQVGGLEDSADTFEKEYKLEESKLKSEIVNLESCIHNFEEKINKSRMDLKNVEVETHAMESRFRKTESKIRSKNEDISKLTSEIMSFKKILTSRIQKRQRRIQERMDIVIPQIMEACEDLREDLRSFSGEDSEADYPI
ncbi:hypothetical protein OY671_004257 [Metschnikowia pulcherrima]|nr:hypothetical protein OY671_004257 [Metschnikowia pulcherrima]